MEPLGRTSSGFPRSVAPGSLHPPESGRRLAQPARIRAGETPVRVLLSAAFIGPLAATPGAAGQHRRPAAGAYRRVLHIGGAQADDRPAATAAESPRTDGQAASVTGSEGQSA